MLFKAIYGSGRDFLQLMRVESGMIDVAGVRRLKCNADIEARKCRKCRECRTCRIQVD